MFEAYMFNIRILKVYFFDVARYVIDRSFLISTMLNLLSYVRHIERSQTFDWPSHKSNCSNA